MWRHHLARLQTVGSHLQARRCLCRPLSSAAAGFDSLIAQVSGQLYIDGDYRAAEGGATLAVFAPRDGKPFTELAHASAADVDAAVVSARRCFEDESWSAAAALPRRVAALKQLAAAIREPAMMHSLSTLESMDCGKPYAEAEGDMNACADYCDYFADIAPAALSPDDLETGSDEPFTAQLVKEAVGVVGCVTPWNYPLMQAVLKVVPALAAGCTVVLKPAPNASLACLVLGKLAQEAGVPSGALNVLTGGPPDSLAAGSSTGQALIDHPGLDKLSFTGSGAAGQQMLIASAAHLRPTSLELGGKSAMVVFDDARGMLPALVDWIMLGIFFTTGQICSATSRVVVESSLHDELVAALTAAAAKLQVGDPLADGTQMGPLVSAMQRDRVCGALVQAKIDGATVVAPPLDLSPELQGGYYVAPTILTQVPVESAAWTEEIFGPVLSVVAFESEAEALAMANATDYGLANAVFSADAARCARVSNGLQSGVVWQNCSQVLFNTTPFGGRTGKKSGFGHEMGEAGLKEYINTKTVVAAEAGHSWNWYGGAGGEAAA